MNYNYIIKKGEKKNWIMTLRHAPSIAWVEEKTCGLLRKGGSLISFKKNKKHFPLYIF